MTSSPRAAEGDKLQLAITEDLVGDAGLAAPGVSGLGVHAAGLEG
jgi:hypothetical protein